MYLSRMPKHQKSAMTLGLEYIMNNPTTSPFTAEGSKAFKEVVSASQMPLTEVLKYVGKNKGKKKAKGPTDAERSQARVEKLGETQGE